MEISNVKAEVSREVVSGLPAQQIDREAQVKAQVRPVEKSAEAARNALDEQRLRREAEKKAKGVSRSEVQVAVDEVQVRMDQMGTNLQFAMDKVAEDLVVKVTDKKSGDLIRQIPSEDVIKLRKKLEELVGLLFDEKA
ncbi:MAG: flagellar protein FlaG [Desulfurivibrionaceae bacterium]|jgi:flagellar protein FlaG|nr:flagellar protein FlaG [Pseudomonadota bacterium]MCG2822188.1 flagellar protein FlaG [Desulfobulbaceae bacterium]MDP2757826.1 flagellar protein FlaG [Desulfurivibrionaceae bacterium]PKN21481.1 MAG: flagellar biosynthesis protein FlaG [Deltaproteobacteria bacterium HGW-Deltaproteobacteria-3]MBU4408272.1 flagellar protein FlaG [Pseudomonadota bacterium]